MVRGMIEFVHTYENIISVENLLGAWCEFVKGKRKRYDVQEFELYLMDHILLLHQELLDKTYRHGFYHAFKISDPKPRHIHKASVRDRVLHHALYQRLYPFFDKKFIADSYSCRLNKGTHKAIERFRKYYYLVSKNNTETVWVLKCDIRKFFASIDQSILMDIFKRHVSNHDIVWLIQKVVESFSSGEVGKGLPLGNLTSQLLVNIYMNEFDQFVKHGLKVRYYIRYADDFVMLSNDKKELEELLSKLSKFLEEKLKLSLHPDKVFIKTLASGIDFLGWIHFPHHRVLRTATKRRMLNRLNEKNTDSYLGLLKHGNAYKLRQQLASNC